MYNPDGDHPPPTVTYVISGRNQSKTMVIAADRAPPPPAEPPAWTELTFHQCGHCPLDPATTRHCPLALSLVQLIEFSEDFVSWDEVHCDVRTMERRIIETTTAQRAFSSIMGLLSALSGCPHTRWFEPMAHHHLPFSSFTETLYRVVGMYATAQHLRRLSGLSADSELTELAARYEAVEQVNLGIAQRLREASETDAGVNAVILLDIATKAVPMSLDDRLRELEPHFRYYLEGDR